MWFHHMFAYDQQQVSDIAHVVKSSLITSFLWQTGSEWHCTFGESSLITFFSFDQTVCKSHYTFSERDSSHHFLWPKACEWHWTFYKRQGSLITFIPMTNREWVTLHIVWVAVLWHIFLLPTASEWYCTLCERQFHHILSYDQQQVSDIAHFVKHSHHIFFYDQQAVSGIAHFVKGSLITPIPIMNREWVALHVLWTGVSSHSFLWPTVGEQHCTFCERQSHHSFSYDQQAVSDVAHFVKNSHISSSYNQQPVSDIVHSIKGILIWTSFPIINSKWVILHFRKSSPIISFPMTNREWVTLYNLWKVVSSHLFLWPTGSEWHCTFGERGSHDTFSYEQ